MKLPATVQIKHFVKIQNVYVTHTILAYHADIMSVIHYTQFVLEKLINFALQIIINVFAQKLLCMLDKRRCA